MGIENLEVAVSCKQGSIVSNFTELKENILAIAEAYKDLAVTEDNIPERKKDVATLRKVVKAVEDKRKEVKKEHMKPYLAFESEIKEVEALVDDVINPINDAIKQVEDEAKLAKLEKCKELYEQQVPMEYREYIPMESVMSDKWLNKTTSEKDIIYDISEKITSLKQDLNTLESLGIPEEIKEKTYRLYKQHGLAFAVQAVSNYKELKVQAQTQVVKEQPVQEKPVENPSMVRITVYAQDAETVEQYCDAMNIAHWRA